MATEIPITKKIIHAAQVGGFQGGPLALGILLKVRGFTGPRGRRDDQIARDGGCVEEYVIREELQGWLELYRLGERVPAGTLRLGNLKRQGGRHELSAVSQ